MKENKHVYTIGQDWQTKYFNFSISNFTSNIEDEEEWMKENDFDNKMSRSEQ